MFLLLYLAIIAICNATTNRGYEFSYRRVELMMQYVGEMNICVEGRGVLLPLFRKSAQ